MIDAQLPQQPALSQPLDGEAFSHWPPQPRVRVLLSFDETEHAFLLAWLRRRPIEFFYWSGSEPGRLRPLRVEELFRLTQYGPAYVHGWCFRRKACRTFRLDRLSLA